MASKKIQLYTDRDKTIEASPETSANCVILSDGNDLQKVLDNDLTTPTVVHEETSFKVGVGDVNVSSSVVDGEVGRMVIKGKTYQNILPEPSLRNSMTNGKSMQKLNEGYENVNVVDGVAKSAILKGQTLVNLNIENMNNGKINAQYSNVARVSDGALKPSTKYLVIVENKSSEEVSLYLNNTTSFIWSEFTVGANSKVAKVGTTKTTITGSIFLSNNKTQTVPQDLSVMLIEYQEGMENWDIPYFTGMQSVKMPVLTTTGKNIWSETDVIQGFYNEDDVFNNSNNLFVTTRNPNKVLPNETYIYSNNLNTEYGIINFYDKDMNIISSIANKNKDPFTTPSNCRFVRICSFVVDGISPDDVEWIQLEKGTIATSYEPYKSNILSTPNDLELRGIGDICDTVDLLTGELTQRVGEIVLNGSEDWQIRNFNEINTECTLFTINIDDKLNNNYYNCDKFKYNNVDVIKANNIEGIYTGGKPNNLFINLSKTKASTVEEFKNWLTNNNVTVQYCCQESIKTVDLSGYGNWDKVVLDGSDDENIKLWNSNANGKAPDVQGFYIDKAMGITGGDNYKVICDGLPSDVLSLTDNNKETIYISGTGKINANIYNSKLETLDLNGLKSYLSQNPIIVWYQTSTSKENSIKEVLSFSNGHIQLSSEEGSLIPSLDYEVPTSNSYHLDLAKLSTDYTLKCDSGNGYIRFPRNTQNYRAIKTNTTIQFYYSDFLGGDQLVYIDGSWTNPMIIEGNFTSTTLPYFTGIKSAFEGKNKIEVLSTGKNLFDGNILGGYIGSSDFKLYDDNGVYKSIKIYLKKGTYTLSSTKPVNIIRLVKDGVYEPISDKFNIKTHTVTLNTDCYFGVSMRDSTSVNTIWEGIDIQIERSLTNSPHEPHKSNNTKIPLLSPLRSLPNGACDELIIDRMKKKATLIQRVGKAMFDGSDNEIWGFMDSPSDTTSYLYQCYVRDAKANSNDASEHLLCKNILVRTANSNWNNKYESGIALNENKNIQLRCTKDESSFRSWLSKNPTTVYYQLETPVVTEVDLEGFPYIYKDGHIFLNSEIAPVVEIAYNVNQTQQIQANNETLQRHELDILDLDNLIVSFVNAEYNLRLLKFDMELSMMALAE